MTQDLAQYHNAQNLYVQRLTAAWRRTFLIEPSTWLGRDPTIEAKMRKDWKILHGISHRQAKIVGGGFNLVPRVDGDKASELGVEVAREIVGRNLKLSESLRKLSSAFFYGERNAWIHFEPQDLTIGDGQKRTWLVPVRLEDVSKWRFRRITDHSPEEGLTASWERWDVGEGLWVPHTNEDALRTIRHVVSEEEENLFFGSALREALAHLWYIKTNLLQESLMAAERLGAGTPVASVENLRDAETGLPNEELMNRWKKELADMRARHILVKDKSDDVEILEGSGQGWQLLESLRQACDDAIDITLLSSKLPTGGGSSEVGSFARADTEQDSMEIVVKLDREALGETMTEDYLGAIWTLNRPNLVELGLVDARPSFSLTPNIQEDSAEIIAVAQGVHGMGGDIDQDDLYERVGLKVPGEGANILRGAAREPAGFGAGVPGFEGLLPEATPAPGPPAIGPAPEARGPESESQDQGQDRQDTAYNGAQVDSLLAISEKVTAGLISPRAATRMLVRAFGMSEEDAQEIVDASAKHVAPSPVEDVTP